MIIFDLDGTLADCEHRRHLLRPQDYPDLCEYSNYFIYTDGNSVLHEKPRWQYKKTGEPVPLGWQEFYEACDRDKPILPVIHTLELIGEGAEYGTDTPWVDYGDVQIWSGRSESVRKKTEKWLSKNLRHYHEGAPILKLRPIGDSTPDDALKEKWLDEALAKRIAIDYVFDDRPKVVRMWRRRGIFVFNCAQSDKEF